MFIRTKKRAGKVYLQLVENTWVDGRTKQRMIKSLGRLDVLQRTGQLDGLLRSGMKFSERLATHEDAWPETIQLSWTRDEIRVQGVKADIRIPRKSSL